MPTYYETLRIRRDASDNDIKKAFRRLAKEYHPDVNRSPNAQRLFCDIYTAYEILSDSTKRKKYDDYLVCLTREQPTTSVQAVEQEIRSWQTHAEAKGRSYAQMPYNEFVSRVLKAVVIVARWGAMTWVCLLAVAWVPIVVLLLFTAPWILIPGALVLWAVNTKGWK